MTWTRVTHVSSCHPALHNCLHLAPSYPFPPTDSQHPGLNPHSAQYSVVCLLCLLESWAKLVPYLNVKKVSPNSWQKHGSLAARGFTISTSNSPVLSSGGHVASIVFWRNRADESAETQPYSMCPIKLSYLPIAVVIFCHCAHPLSCSLLIHAKYKNIYWRYKT